MSQTNDPLIQINAIVDKFAKFGKILQFSS